MTCGSGTSPRHIAADRRHTRRAARSACRTACPADLTQAFFSMYRQQLAVLQNSLPPRPASRQIAELEQKIEILEDFLATLN